jgi:hypothetical protein
VLCWISLAVASWVGLCFLIQKHFYPVSMGLRKFLIKEKPDFYATLGYTLIITLARSDLPQDIVVCLIELKV